MTRTATSAAPTAADAAEQFVETPVVEFPSGIPGFEAHRRFVLIASAELSPLGGLKSVDSSDLSFLVIDPTFLSFGYDLTLNDFDRARLQAGPPDAVLCL